MTIFCRPVRADVVPDEKLPRRQKVAAVDRNEAIVDQHLADGARDARRRRLDVRETSAGRRQSQSVVRAQICRQKLQD